MELRYYMTTESKIMAYDRFNGSSSRDKIPIKKKPIGMLVFTLRLTWHKNTECYTAKYKLKMRKLQSRMDMSSVHSKFCLTMTLC